MADDIHNPTLIGAKSMQVAVVGKGGAESGERRADTDPTALLASY